jgi:predicted transcriptional regulator
MKDQDNKEILESTQQVVFLLTPGPLGRGLTEDEAAKELGISQQAINERLETFKKRHPKAYERFKVLKELSVETREHLKNVSRIGDEIEDIEEQVEEKW